MVLYHKSLREEGACELLCNSDYIKNLQYRLPAVFSWNPCPCCYFALFGLNFHKTTLSKKQKVLSVSMDKAFLRLYVDTWYFFNSLDMKTARIFYESDQPVWSDIYESIHYCKIWYNKYVITCTSEENFSPQQLACEQYVEMGILHQV